MEWAMAVDLILIRHGESDYNAGNTAHLNSALTPDGVAQAKAAARE
jgi:broad specificity phosphatase PhoE